MARTKDETLREITQDYLQQLIPGQHPDPADVQADILEKVSTAFSMRNSVAGKTEQWRIPDKLAPSQIADIILSRYTVANIACAGANTDTEYDLLAIYQTDGPNAGIYVSNEQMFRNIARAYGYTLGDKDCQEIIQILKDCAPRKLRCDERNLIAVNNGIFDYDTKQLLPFSPELIFISKSRVNYNPQAMNPVIQNPDGTSWDIESWMNDLFDDPEIVEVMWQIIGAIIRPNVAWNKSAWLYSNTGNNGKGTLCELMRQITGEGSYASIPLADFAKDFALEPLTRASAIIVDENDVGTFIDKAANLKAIITGDVISMNRKFKSIIAYQFKGFMVQCLNEYPRIKDKSDSFYRRQLFVPFTKCFTGIERKYIKNDYLQRTDVLEYALHKVLNMDYYQLSEPNACKAALEEYKSFNDPIRMFVDEVLPRCVWDLLPLSFLYDLYKSWFKKTTPTGTVVGRNTFVTDLINALRESQDWYCPGTKQAIRVGHKMDTAEPLIAEYDLKEWMNPKCKNTNDIELLCHPPLTDRYRCILRWEPNRQVNTADDDD